MVYVRSRLKTRLLFMRCYRDFLNQVSVRIAMLGDLLLRVLGISLNLEGVLKMLLVLRVNMLLVY